MLNCTKYDFKYTTKAHIYLPNLICVNKYSNNGATMIDRLFELVYLFLNGLEILDFVRWHGHNTNTNTTR